MELICSMGPNIKDINDIDAFVQAGMTMPRFNFSHINYEKFEGLIKEIRVKYPTMKVLQDLQGNKLRVSKLYTYENKVFDGEPVLFCLEDKYERLKNNAYNNKIKLIPISYSGTLEDFSNVKEIYMKDATMRFKVIEKNGDFIKAATIKGGILRAEKGVNAPGLNREMLSLTKKDKYDIEVGIKNKVDIICASYVTSVKDIKEVKDYIKKIKAKHKIKTSPKVWAKIECREGIENFEEILAVSDGIMIGRGDLKAEISLIDIPYEQEKIIMRMKKSNKTLIIATHILESMRREERPTLSEICAVTYFIKNKVNGLMLCTEVSITSKPTNVIKWINNLYQRYGD